MFVTHSVFESVYLSSRIVVMAARPGRVFTELEIDAPYPRDEDFRTSAEYAAFCRRTSEALAQRRTVAAGGVMSRLHRPLIPAEAGIDRVPETFAGTSGNLIALRIVLPIVVLGARAFALGAGGVVRKHSALCAAEPRR